MHYIELQAKLILEGFLTGLYTEESVVGDKPRIYLHGYGEKAKVYLFVDPTRRQNNHQNPISGFGLHVNIDIPLEAKKKLQERQKLKHKVMTDLFSRGISLRPITNYKLISL